MVYELTPHIAVDGSAEIDNKIIDIMNTYKVVGLQAQVIKDGQTIWSNQYGLANLEKQIPVNSTTFFRVASISKTAVATAIMQQYEQGKFQLDDDISDCLGYLVRNPHFPHDKITYRHVMTHTTSFNRTRKQGMCTLLFRRPAKSAIRLH
jgi:CubicO group peptidase (beta-lactamase class C family)